MRIPIRRSLLALGASLAIAGNVAGNGRGAEDPALSGVFPAGRMTVRVPGMEGRDLSVDVHYPREETGEGLHPAAVPCPVILLGHGFSQSKAQHANQGRHLASRGYLVLAPDFNAPASHGRNADELRKCLDWAEARQADASSIFHRRLRLDRVGATGHSAGGLSAIVAASRDRRIRALAPMDPVDKGGLGAKALADLEIPVAIVHSDPSPCNANGSAESLYAEARAPKRRVWIVGANHSDAQDPAGLLGVIACGRPDPARQALYRRHVAAWFDYHLKGDKTSRPWVFDLPGGGLAEDIAAGRIEHEAEGLPLSN